MYFKHTTHQQVVDTTHMYSQRSNDKEQRALHNAQKVEQCSVTTVGKYYIEPEPELEVELELELELEL